MTSLSTNLQFFIFLHVLLNTLRKQKIFDTLGDPKSFLKNQEQQPVQQISKNTTPK